MQPPRFLEILWGAWWAGLAVVPDNAKLQSTEVEWIIDNAQARWGFVRQDVAPQALRGLERQVDAQSPEAEAPVVATAAALREGWLWTVDVGCLDAGGFLTLNDRSKGLLIRGGSNIYPREVEEMLLTAHGVAEVAVVRATDPEWGEVVVVFVVARPGVAPDEAALDSH